MDLTHVTASVVGGQQYSRPGDSDIYHGRTRQRGCVPRKLPQQPSAEQSHKCYAKPKVLIPTEELQDICRASVQRLTNLKKNIIPEGCTQGKFG